MRFSTTHEIDLRKTDHLRILALLLLVVADGWVMCNVTLIVIKKRSGCRHMRIAVAGRISRSAWAGAATTARSDDLEFLAIQGRTSWSTTARPCLCRVASSRVG